MKKSSRQNGITLLALVLTIIILLILAGIAISAITGENGLINRTKDAEIKQRHAAVLEQYKIYQHDSSIATTVPEASSGKTIDEFITELKSKGLINDAEMEEANTDGKITYTYSDGSKQIIELQSPGGGTDPIDGTYTNIPNSSTSINLANDNTWTFMSAGGDYEYQGNTLSIIYQGNLAAQFNVTKINDITVLYSENMPFGGFLFAKDPSKIVKNAFAVEKTGITCNGFTYTFKTDGTFTATNGSQNKNGNYGIYSGLSDYILMGNAGTDWYKFTSETTMESLN